MDDEPRRILHIESEGNIRVSEIRNFLESLENAYNGTLVFMKIMDQLQEGSKEPLLNSLVYMARRRDAPPYVPAPWWFARDSISDFVSPSEQLILRRVQLASPGSWDFLGIAGVFGVIREYLKDRDERRKDKEYREAFERERLRLENEIRKNEVISGRLKIARDLGFKEDDSFLILDRFVVQPLGKLGAAQDRGLIAGVKEEDIDDDRP